MDETLIDKILKSEESETIERKKGWDSREVRKALIAFANDQSDRGCGYLVVGQDDNKQLVGLAWGEDEICKRISDVSRDMCFPAVPVSIDVVERQGKRIAVVTVRRSVARPHFDGPAWVRVGSTTRRATDAEVMLLRAATGNRKAALLMRWIKKVVVVTAPNWAAPLKAMVEDVTEDWVQLRFGNKNVGIPLSDMSVGFDYTENAPKIWLSVPTGSRFPD